MLYFAINTFSNNYLKNKYHYLLIRSAFSSTQYMLYLLKAALAEVNSQEKDVKQMLKDKSDLLMDLPETDSQRLKEHSNRAKQSTESAKERLSDTHR